MTTATTGKTPPTDPLSHAERRRVLIAVAILVAAIAVGAAAWVAFADDPAARQSGDVCVSVTEASSTGGGIERACGDAARTWCRAAYAQVDAHAQRVQAQCRAADIKP